MHYTVIYRDSSDIIVSAGKLSVVLCLFLFLLLDAVLPYTNAAQFSLGGDASAHLSQIQGKYIIFKHKWPQAKRTTWSECSCIEWVSWSGVGWL